MMKYKITAVAISAFLALFAVLYVYTVFTEVFDVSDAEKTSFSYFKNMLLTIRDKGDSTVPFKERYIAAKGIYDRITLKRYYEYENQSVARLDNGYLVYGSNEKKDCDVQALADAVAQFDECLRGDGIDLIYIQAPEKLCQNDKSTRLPIGIYSESPDISEFMSCIRENGVDCIDLEERLHIDGKDHYGLFFRSDHHWKPETGFWANQLLCEKLQNEYGYEIDDRVTDTDQYNCTVYKDCFIGPQGRRAGYLSAPKDDFSLIYPKFDTDLTVKIHNEEYIGSFENTVLRSEYINTGMFTSHSLYYAYTDKVCDFKIIKNNNDPNGKKVVLLCDSFGWTVAPYLALTCGQVHMLDLREVKGVSAYDYAKNVGADTVVILYNAGFVGADESFFDFFSVKE